MKMPIRSICACSGTREAMIKKHRMHLKTTAMITVVIMMMMMMMMMIRNNAFQL